MFMNTRIYHVAQYVKKPSLKAPQGYTRLENFSLPL